MSNLLGGGEQKKQLDFAKQQAAQQMALQKQQLGLQTEQSNLAKEQFALQTAEQERLRLQTEEEQRMLQEQLAAKKQSRTRGGQRLLLSEARLNPEMGLDEESLGA
jgi:hypothetical protein